MILFLDGGYTLAAGNETCAEIIQKCLQHEELVLVKLEENMDWNSVYRYLEDAHAIVLARVSRPAWRWMCSKISAYMPISHGEEVWESVETRWRRTRTRMFFGAGVTKTRQITGRCPCRSTRFLSEKKYREQMCILNQKKCQERGIFAK